MASPRGFRVARRFRGPLTARLGEVFVHVAPTGLAGAVGLPRVFAAGPGHVPGGND